MEFTVYTLAMLLILGLTCLYIRRRGRKEHLEITNVVFSSTGKAK
jgi:hypothetical protein